MRETVAIAYKPDGISIAVTPARFWPVIIFLGVWLVMWTRGGIGAVQSMIEPAASRPSALEGNVLTAFLSVWLAGWLAGELAVIAILAWNLAGREIIRVNHGDMYVKLAVGKFGWQRRYNVSLITEMKTHPGLTGSAGNPGAIDFIYNKKTVPFCTMAKPGDAEKVFNELKRHLPRKCFADPVNIDMGQENG